MNFRLIHSLSIISLVSTVYAGTVMDRDYLSLTAPERDKKGAASIREPALKHHRAFVATHPGWNRPAVWVDPENKRVLVWAQATGMKANEPVEFFVIGEASGHDYESIAMIFAKPSDLHAAMEEAGFKAGSPVDSSKQRFWPRGDRVRCSVHVNIPGGEEGKQLPLLEFTQNSEGTSHADLPWVFVGSEWIPNPQDPNELLYAADAFSPNSVASTFNLINTVFDLPRRGSKTATYGDYNYKPSLELPMAQPILLEFTACPTSKTRSIDLHLATNDAGKIEFTLNDHARFNDINELTRSLAQWRNEDVTAQLDFASNLTLAQTRQLAISLRKLENELELIQVAPPKPGQLFYQAYLPNPIFRERNKRPSQPLELHLSRNDTGLQATLHLLDEVWGEGSRPKIVETLQSFDAPDDLRDVVLKQKNRKPALFIHAPAQTHLSELQRWADPIIEFFPVIYVFAETQ